MMASLYLPWVTEQETGHDTPPVFFGGVNAYLQQKSGLFRKTPRWLDRLFDAAPLLRLSSKFTHMTRPHDLGELTLSMVRGEQGRQFKELDRLAHWIAEQDEVGAVLLNNVLLVGMARRIQQIANVPVICTLQGEEAFIDSLPAEHRDATWAELRRRQEDIAAFICVSQTYGDIMRRRLGLPDDRIHIVYNGIDVDDLSPADAPPAMPTIGYFARLCRDKGLGELIDAFVLLKRTPEHANVKLTVAGAMTPADHKYVKGLRAQLAEAGVAEDVTFEPNVTRQRKIEFLRGLTMLSVPATYGESFGLYVIEAWACGVPVAQPRSGAFEELLALGQGGMLHEPNDAASLAETWCRMLADPAGCVAMGRNGREAVLDHFTADRMAAGVKGVIQSVVEAGIG